MHHATVRLVHTFRHLQVRKVQLKRSRTSFLGYSLLCLEGFVKQDLTQGNICRVSLIFVLRVTGIASVIES